MANAAVIPANAPVIPAKAPVIPAKAGIQETTAIRRRSSQGRIAAIGMDWIPAFGGMTDANGRTG